MRLFNDNFFVNRVSFPEKLNLNSFVAHTKGEEANNESTPEEVIVKCDDSSTTDSGSALDDEGCQGIDTVSVPNSNENHNTDYQVCLMIFSVAP